jgi:hypothetical protein
VEPVWIAFIVTFGSALGSALVAYITYRQRRAEKAQDWARQDEVADRAAAQAKAAEERQAAVAAQAAEAARLLLAANAEVALVARRTAESVDGKLNQIHELVNSTLTGALEDQLLAREQLLVLMRERPGQSPEARKSLADMEDMVAELRAKLADRARQTAVADAKVK